MNFIPAERFLELSEEVQKVFLDWWEPKKGDIYCNLYNGQEENVLVINECQFVFKSFAKDIKKYGIPLLQMHHLIQFIEDKKKKKLEYAYCMRSGYDVTLTNGESFEVLECDLGYDLLESLFKTAIRVAEQEVEHE